MLTIIAIGGRKIISKFQGISNENGWFKRTLGIMFLLVGLSIMTGLDKRAEAAILTNYNIPAIETAVISSLSPNTSSSMDTTIKPNSDSKNLAHAYFA